MVLEQLIEMMGRHRNLSQYFLQFLRVAGVMI